MVWWGGEVVEEGLVMGDGVVLCIVRVGERGRVMYGGSVWC